MAPIAPGGKIPDVTLVISNNQAENGACARPSTVKTGDIFGVGKKVVLFAVPGAFTPGCQEQHLPGFIKHYDAIKQKGIDAVYCTSTNDVFVLDAWAKNNKIQNKITMLADGNGDWAKAIGLDRDMQSGRMGAIRSKRYAMIIESGVCKWIGVDEKGVEQSTAEMVLSKL